jgi:hypothetical protein
VSRDPKCVTACWKPSASTPLRAWPAPTKLATCASVTWPITSLWPRPRSHNCSAPGAATRVLDTLATELPNLRAAVEWAAVSDPDAGLRLVTALSLFWVFTGCYREGDICYARALDAAGAEPTVLRGRAMASRASLGHYGGAAQLACGWAQTALDIGEKCGDTWTQGRALKTLGLKASLGDPAGGRVLLQRSVELATQSDDDWCRIDAANCLAIDWTFQDGFDTARPLLEDLQASVIRLDYRWGLAWPSLCLGGKRASRAGSLTRVSC